MTRSAECPSCGCSQPDGILCSDDTAAVETMLAAVPELVQQLDLAISKQARLSGGKAGQGTARERVPINWGAVAARDALVIEAAFVGQDVNWLRRHPQAAEMVSSFGRVVKEAYRVIDRARERQYLGQCLYSEGGLVCHAELWVKPHAGTVRCTQCEHEHDVASRRAKLLKDAEDVICTPREASQYLGEIGGIPVGHQRIRNYVDRKRIPAKPSPDGTMLIRMGDLLEVILSESEKRSA